MLIYFILPVIFSLSQWYSSSSPWSSLQVCSKGVVDVFTHRSVTMNTSSAPLPPYFWMHGEPCNPGHSPMCHIELVLECKVQPVELHHGRYRVMLDCTHVLICTLHQACRLMLHVGSGLHTSFTLLIWPVGLERLSTTALRKKVLGYVACAHMEACLYP